VVGVEAETPEAALGVEPCDVVLWPAAWPRPRGLGGPGAVILCMGYGTPEPLPGDVHGWLSKPIRVERLRRRLLARTATDPLTRSGTRPPTSVPPLPDGRRLRVLVAEDNPVNQRVMGAMLAQLGVEATLVGDGLGALAALDAQRFDLVLMDGQMPHMDGETAARAIRGRADAARDVPIVAVTAHAMVGDRERFLAVGMNEHLPKPVTLRALAGVLARFGASAGTDSDPLALEDTPDAERRAVADPQAGDEFRATRRALLIACEAAQSMDEASRARAWRRLRSAALWAEMPDLAALADRPADEDAALTAARLDEARALG
jgi:CheY-like chemotaxis protein